MWNHSLSCKLCKPGVGIKYETRPTKEKGKWHEKADPAKRELIQQMLTMYQPKDFKEFNEMLEDIFADVMQQALEGGLDEELGYTKYDYRNKETTNNRNGYGKKSVATSMGEVELTVPRDRDGEFESQIIQKRQNKTTGDLEEKVLSIYAKGMTTEDISGHLDDIYGVDVSDSMISRITDKIMPVVREWQTRPLEEVYAIVYLDAIHFHVRHEGTVIKKAVLIALCINMEGYKDVIGMWVGENESSKFWISVLNEIKNRNT